MKILRTALVVAALAASSGGVAQPRLPSTSVDYSDLNLARAEGRAALEERVRVAAARLCRTYLAGATAELTQRLTCARLALFDARPQLERAVALSRADHFAGRRTIRVALGQ